MPETKESEGPVHDRKQLERELREDLCEARQAYEIALTLSKIVPEHIAGTTSGDSPGPGIGQQAAEHKQAAFDRYHRALKAFADLVVHDRSPSADQSHPQAPSARNVLTPRETEVLKLIAAGLSTKEIAASLGITFKTAACHRSRIMEKLDIHDVVSLVWYAIENKVVKLGAGSP
jgi:DNA-binding CsgD family transcriptional regulator